jgi:hypothetical protein
MARRDHTSSAAWYTPDYRHWWDALRPSLDRHGAPHDFVEVPKVSTQWEANTMRKPHEVAKALTRHPDKVVIFIDVDCVVHGPLPPTACRRRRGRKPPQSAQPGWKPPWQRSASGWLQKGQS